MSKNFLLVQNNTIYCADANAERFRDTFVMLENKAKTNGWVGVSGVVFTFVPHPNNSLSQALVAYGKLENDLANVDIFS